MANSNVVFKIEDTALSQLREQIYQSYGEEGEESVTEAWDSMQQLFKCCGVSGGVNSSDSWALYKKSSTWFTKLSESVKSPLKIEYVPTSCCKDTENTPNVTQCQGLINKAIIPQFGPPITSEDNLNDQLYTEGCYTSLRNMLTSNLVVLVGVGAGIAVAMVLGMVFSICLCKRIKNDDDDYYDCDD
ncbi:CD82 antigen-like [Ruditapes philippinarum]|uniref:CD82 antigen-like n=1 Tax=Ruditapes philippinarum TaxID=129788 RepID=UPI00295C12DE|nr:CD82 antigen-like [Ruditapes philippinarum]